LDNAKMKGTALVVGGSNGIGAAICLELLDRDYGKIYILDRQEPCGELDNEKISFLRFNLVNKDISILNRFHDIDSLVITAGFGRIAPFEDITDIEIMNGYGVNTIAVTRIIRHYYHRIISDHDFYTCIVGSIAGLVSSPMFSVYGATKAAVCKLVESLNIEIEKYGSNNRILNVSPGAVPGTAFNGEANDLGLVKGLAMEIVNRMQNREVLYIPDYDGIYKNVIERYNNNSRGFGLESYDYKMSRNTITEPQIKTGYLSGTFDLFHIGHLNLLRRAKDYCDQLIVGVHKDASHKRKATFIPFQERLEIIKGIKYVDRVVESCPEDSDAYIEFKYDYLFVGSDYKGSERFNRYETFFKDKDVKIIYLPYTKETNSTQLRNIISLQNCYRTPDPLLEDQ